MNLLFDSNWSLSIRKFSTLIYFERLGSVSNRTNLDWPDMIYSIYSNLSAKPSIKPSLLISIKLCLPSWIINVFWFWGSPLASVGLDPGSVENITCSPLVMILRLSESRKRSHLPSLWRPKWAVKSLNMSLRYMKEWYGACFCWFLARAFKNCSSVCGRLICLPHSALINRTS